jgi:hypothetical protein
VTATSNRVWTTKDGRRIRIRDMEDSHLFNTIQMLRRNAPKRKRRLAAELAQEENAGWQVLCMLQGEHAIDACEQDLDDISRQRFWVNKATPMEILEADVTYQSLVKEATKRGILSAEIPVNVPFNNESISAT